jgi:hypothetical protein
MWHPKPAFVEFDLETFDYCYLIDIDSAERYYKKNKVYHRCYAEQMLSREIKNVRIGTWGCFKRLIRHKPTRPIVECISLSTIIYEAVDRTKLKHSNCYYFTNKEQFNPGIRVYFNIPCNNMIKLCFPTDSDYRCVVDGKLEPASVYCCLKSVWMRKK